MPLVERYGDWETMDGSHDDPHTLAFDHRLDGLESESETVRPGMNLAGMENNLKATCLITSLYAEYGWTETSNGDWVYDPDGPEVHSRSTLDAHFQHNIGPCTTQDQRNIMNELLHNLDPASSITDEGARKALEAMEWPADGTDLRGSTSFRCRFPLSNQYIAGATWCSGYHLGNGLVATAGHCVQPYLSSNSIATLKIVFGWSGEVRRKRFRAEQIFGIEKVLLCNAPTEYNSASHLNAIADWVHRWDTAVIRLKGVPGQFCNLAKVELAVQPPKFGSNVYNAGCPLGTPLRISPNGHVLHHALFNGDNDPFSHAITAQGTYSTDLDQFPGNSGGPVFDASTGKVVGHTVSTQNAVSEATMDDIESWERNYLANTANYRAVNEMINPHLAEKKPGDPSSRIHSKFYRTLSGDPSGGALFLNTTFICPGDIGPNDVKQPQNSYQAVFNRHKWDSPDVMFRNLTGRIDKVSLFTKPLKCILDDNVTCSLVLKMTGNRSTFRKPELGASVAIFVCEKIWRVSLSEVSRQTTPSPASVTYIYSIDISLGSNTSDKTADSPLLPSCLADWTHFRFEQPSHNPPDQAELEIIILRAAFAFPIDNSWPPNRTDLTSHSLDESLVWPAEEFRFTTNFSDTAASTITISGKRLSTVSGPRIQDNRCPNDRRSEYLCRK
ncbi:hypothetical protein ACLMJK_004262 [Lecanora helva]